MLQLALVRRLVDLLFCLLRLPLPARLALFIFHPEVLISAQQEIFLLPLVQVEVAALQGLLLSLQVRARLGMAVQCLCTLAAQILRLDQAAQFNSLLVMALHRVDQYCCRQSAAQPLEVSTSLLELQHQGRRDLFL